MSFLRQTVVCNMAIECRMGNHSILELVVTISPARLCRQYSTLLVRALGGSSTTLLAECRRADGICGQSPWTDSHTFHLSRAGS